MVAYSIFLNFVEILTLTTFVYLYYSLSSRKQFCLLLTSLFLICELCDILRENGIILMIEYYATSYLFILHNKQTIHLGDMFILGGYIFVLFLFPFFFHYLFTILLTQNNLNIFIITVGLFSKFFLILFTYWLLNHLKYNFVTPNKQYILVILTEIIVLSIFGIIGYAAVDVTVSYSPFLICILLLSIFVLIIMNGIYLNRIYTEKMQYEKQLQKEKYIKQSLRLIQNISYDIDDKKHRIHWILEHIKHLNNDTNTKISKAIEQYQSKNTYHVKRNSEITLHIKGQGIYTLVELYSENDFYDYDRCKIESDLIVKKKNIYKDGIYYMKFLLKGTDDDVRENL